MPRSSGSCFEPDERPWVQDSSAVHAVLASPSGGLGYRPGQFVISILTGVAGAVIGVAVLWVCLRRPDFGEVLDTTSQLACVVGSRLDGGARS